MGGTACAWSCTWQSDNAMHRQSPSLPIHTRAHSVQTRHRGGEVELQACNTPGAPGCAPRERQGLHATVGAHHHVIHVPQTAQQFHRGRDAAVTAANPSDTARHRGEGKARPLRPSTPQHKHARLIAGNTV
jgi:hypothetical protein